MNEGSEQLAWEGRERQDHGVLIPCLLDGTVSPAGGKTLEA